MHILVLTDRDWTHPQGGGTGTHLRANVDRWLALGHRVTVIACGYRGCVRTEREGDLTIHRLAGRVTVYPVAIWKQWRGLVPDADVVLEIINGITFLTPLWLRTPRVALVHHVHRPHYVQEMGRLRGSLAATLLETLPLKLLYRRTPFLTISGPAADAIASHGIDREAIEVRYCGVAIEDYAPGRRAAEPTMLFLGRLKRYKRIEYLLEATERTPELRLEIAGDGDHRDQLEEEIARRGLGDRVRMHGHVDEAKKLELLQAAWVNATASSNEGWCLTVMEAGRCETPTVAMAVGGLRESVVHGETGLLAPDDDVDALTEHVQSVVRDPELRATLGRLGSERAARFTWDANGDGNLRALERAVTDSGTAAPRRGLRDLARSDTGKAAGLAGAVIAANMLALAFTIVFARLLGSSGYGSLAALISAFVILMVPGSALQVTVAREVSKGTAGGASVRVWLRHIALATVVVAVLAVPLRGAVAAALNVEEHWAAALVPVCAMLWMILSVQRGALQGRQHYRLVGLSILGEATGRLVIGVILVGVGLDVTGAFLATPMSLLVTAGVLLGPLLRTFSDSGHGKSLSALLAGSWVPVVGLTLLFALQEVHVIVVKHEVSSSLAGAYGVAAVAAKGIIWVAVGLAMYLLPEAARRAHDGVDARPILLRTLALIAAVAAPMVVVYTVASEPLLRIVFGPDLTGAAGALPWLGLAMSLLACAYLAVQYMLALGRSAFVWVLVPAAAAEVAVLSQLGGDLTTVAVSLAVLQLVCAAAVLSLSMRARPARTLPA